MFSLWFTIVSLCVPQVGGGGCVEDALVDLTGGVAGRFYTADAGGAETGRGERWESPWEIL